MSYSAGPGPRPLYPALGLGLLTAWLTAALLVGRALPWQASRWWLAAFVLALLVASPWWWRFFGRTQALAPNRTSWWLAAAWGAAPFLAVALPALALAYLSDPLNHLLEGPYWRMPLLVSLGLLLVATDSLQSATTGWLRSREEGAPAALRAALARRAVPVTLGCLVAVAALQAAASVAPIGDDVWHYVKVADSLRDGLRYPDESLGPGSQYPVDIMGHDYTRAGMARVYPALPLFPTLLAIAFTLLGHNTAAVALVLAAATALFPLALYAACKALTGSRLAAYIGALLIFLFPVYQIHILGAPEPDGLFVALLLLVAAVAARAEGSPRERDWLAMGAAMGTAALTRHEGVYYSAALFGVFFLFHRAKRAYWLSVAAWLAMLLPFALLHYISTGSPWPNTFGGTLSWHNLELNLSILSWTSLPWFAQAVGMGKDALVALFLAACVAAGIAALAFWASGRPALAFIPLAGVGDVAMALMVHPQVLQTPSPIEFLRHISSGLAYLALAAVYAAYVGYRWAAWRVRPWSQLLLKGALLLLACALLVYQSDRLARPEYYFDGRASLLWTGSGYLLPDLLERPVSLPMPDDPRAGEQLRDELGLPLDEVDLRRVNRSEPYHWTSLLLALFGLAYSAISSTHRIRTARPSDSLARHRVGPPA